MSGVYLLKKDGLKAVLVLASVLFVAVGLNAQSATPAPKPPGFAISYDKAAAENIHADGITTLNLHLKNNSDQEITLTHFAVNSPSVFAPIESIHLKPGGEADFPLQLRGRSLPLPSSLMVFFQVQDGAFRVQAIELSSKDVLVTAPRFVVWRVGDPAAAKTARIVNVPAGLKVTGVASSTPDFTAKLSGDTITIFPADTAKAHSGAIIIATEPASRHMSISVAVIQAYPLSKASVAPPKGE